MQAITEVLQSNPQLPQAGDLEVGKEQRELERIARVEAYLRRLREKQYPTIKSASDMLNLVVWRGEEMYRRGQIETPFVLDGNNLDAYQQLAAYFSGDYETWPCSLSPRKGVLLFGGYGCGKTLAMQLFASNPFHSYRIMSARSIAEDYKLNGDVQQYRGRFHGGCSARWFGQYDIGLCIGDLGSERADAKNYGSGFSIGDLIQDRYENHQTRGPWTHAETNAIPEELLAAYGPRTYDKMRGLFNIIEFPEQPSRRI